MMSRYRYRREAGWLLERCSIARWRLGSPRDGGCEPWMRTRSDAREAWRGRERTTKGDGSVGKRWILSALGGGRGETARKVVGDTPIFEQAFLLSGTFLTRLLFGGFFYSFCKLLTYFPSPTCYCNGRYPCSDLAGRISRIYLCRTKCTLLLGGNRRNGFGDKGTNKTDGRIDFGSG